MTPALRGAALSCLLLAAALLDASAAGFHDTLNDLRAGLQGCPKAGRAAPFIPRPELERVARNLAYGGDLRASMKQFGYRALRSHAIHLEGGRVATQAASLLAQQGYCRHLQDPALRDVGYYLHEDKLWIVLAAPFAPSPGLTGPAAGRRVLELVNQARARARNCGDQPFAAAPPLRWNDTLATASLRHAEDMARHNYFSHTGRDRSNPAQRVERAGYRYRMTGENIASGAQMTPDDAVAGWIKSPDHCANLMNAGYTEMGAAYAVNANSEMGVYWAQVFGKPR
jgi:uncharacterized protein YkwD